MNTGTLKWYNSIKGYGFIEPDNGGEDVFLHASAIECAGLGTLREGQKFRYDLEQSRNGKLSARSLQAL